MLATPGPLAARSLERTPGTPRIAFARMGCGETVVFLHGIGGNHDNWCDQLNAVALTHQAVAWDARGYGDSDDYDGPCRFEDFSDDLAHLLDHLGARRAHLVGLSMGGRILMDFAVRHPARVQSLVIAASFPSFGRALSPDQQESFMRLRREPLEQGRTFAELAPELVESLTGPHATPVMREHMSRSIRRLRSGSYLKTLESTLHFDRTDVLPLIKAPTLLMFGELDPLVTPAAGREVHALMPHAEFLVIPSVGHLINIEATETFNDAVLHFISRHPVHV